MNIRSARMALLALVILGGSARLISSASIPFIWDEYQWTAIADSVTLSLLNLPLHGDAHPVGAVYTIFAGAQILGRNLVGYRLASVVFGTLLIWLAWGVVRRDFGPAAGLVAAAFVAGNEYLLGISRIATEEIVYLAVSAVCVWTFLRLMEDGKPSSYLAFGLSLGAGLMMKETLILWAPVFVLELLSRRGARELMSRRALGTLGVIALMTTPEWIWLVSRADPSSASDRGATEHVSRLGLGVSLGPSALFVRAIPFPPGDEEVSEYPAMTMPAGLLLLAGGVAGLALARVPGVRLWLGLGWFPFLFFTLLGNPKGGPAEFWWSDLSILPFIALTSALLVRGPRWLAPLAVAAILPGAWAVATSAENCYPRAALDPSAALETCLSSQRAFVATFPARDHASLSRMGPASLPAASFYRQQTRNYLAWLRGGQSAQGKPWPDLAPKAREAEIRRMERALQSLETNPGKR